MSSLLLTPFLIYSFSYVSCIILCFLSSMLRHCPQNHTYVWQPYPSYRHWPMKRATPTVTIPTVVTFSPTAYLRLTTLTTYAFILLTLLFCWHFIQLTLLFGWRFYSAYVFIQLTFLFSWRFYSADVFIQLTFLFSWRFHSADVFILITPTHNRK